MSGNDSNAKLLLHGDGTNGATTFPDASASAHTVTPTNVTVDTSQSKFGGASAKFVGTGRLLLDGSSDFAHAGDFTIDFWIQFSSVAGQVNIYDPRAVGATGAYFVIYKGPGTGFKMYDLNASLDAITGTTVPATSTWYHVALARSGSSTKLFINGVQEGSTYTDSTSWLVGASRPSIGADGSSSSVTLGLNGWIEELRVSNSARWTTTFTPPTAAYDNVISGVGASAGVAAATAVGRSTFSAVGASAGVGAALATGASLVFSAGVGAASGAAAAAAIGASFAASVALSVGASTVSGVLNSFAAAVAASAGSSAPTAVGRGINPAVGASAGASSPTAVGSGVLGGVGSSAGVGAATAVGRSFAAGVALSAGVAAAAAFATALASSIGSAIGAAVAASVGTGVKNSVGAAAGTGAGTGVGTSIASSIASAAGTSGRVSLASLASLLSTTRASPALTYALNAAGVLVPFAANAPRITDLGLLVEESRRNEFCGSALPPSAILWTGTATANYGSAPDGTLSATRLQWTNPDGGYSYGNNAFTNVAGATYTSSMYVKPLSSASAIVILNGSWFGVSNANYTFDFSTMTGIAGHQDGGGNLVTNVSGSATAIGNGWYRLTVTGTHSKALTTEFQGGFVPKGGSSGDVLVWGFQCELGSFATSLIPTTPASGVTRDEDVIAVTGANFKAILSSGVGSIYAALGAQEGINGSPRIIGDFAPNELLGFGGTLGSSNAQMYNAANTPSLGTGNSADLSTPQVLASSWDASGRSVVLNGGAVATDTKTAFATTDSNWFIGAEPGVQVANGYIQRIAVWNTRLSDAVLQTMTATGVPQGAAVHLNFVTGVYAALQGAGTAVQNSVGSSAGTSTAAAGGTGVLNAVGRAAGVSSAYATSLVFYYNTELLSVRPEIRGMHVTYGDRAMHSPAANGGMFRPPEYRDAISLERRRVA